MYARLVAGTLVVEKVEDAIRLWKESVAPSVRQQKGFRNARLLVNRRTGQVASMGLWETEADFLGSVEWNQGQLAGFAEMFAAPPGVAGYELIADVLPD